MPPLPLQYVDDTTYAGRVSLHQKDMDSCGQLGAATAITTAGVATQHQRGRMVGNYFDDAVSPKESSALADNASSMGNLEEEKHKNLRDEGVSYIDTLCANKEQKSAQVHTGAKDLALLLLVE